MPANIFAEQSQNEGRKSLLFMTSRRRRRHRTAVRDVLKERALTFAGILKASTLADKGLLALIRQAGQEGVDFGLLVATPRSWRLIFAVSPLNRV